MKRYEWTALEAGRLQLQVREVTPVVCQDRESAIRGALLERFPSDTDFAPSAPLHPRGNA